MTTTIDAQALELKVKDMYRLVAREPRGHFHFELGRGLALRLGYDADRLTEVPSPAVDSFAGVGHFFDLADLHPENMWSTSAAVPAWTPSTQPGSSGRPARSRVSTSRSSSWPRHANSPSWPGPRRWSSGRAGSSNSLSRMPITTA